MKKHAIITCKQNMFTVHHSNKALILSNYGKNVKILFNYVYLEYIKLRTKLALAIQSIQPFYFKNLISTTVISFTKYY